MESLTTPRMQLPMLAAGQAQKEVTHNDALIHIDSLLFPHVEAAGVNAPPANPVAGQAWIVGDGPIGAWLGKAHQLAIWSIGGWRYVTLPLGSVIPVGNPRKMWRCAHDGWHPPVTVNLPTGGVTVDAEARHALDSLIAAITDYGVIMTG